MKSRIGAWVCRVLPVCLVMLLTACLENTQTYTAESETTGRIEWREFKKWAEESPRTMDDVRKRTGSGGQRAENKGETNEVWIYEHKFYDKERKKLIKVYEIPFATNGVVKAKLPDYRD